VLSGIANIGRRAAADALGPLFFRYCHGAAERLAHRGIAAALGANHRSSDALQFGSHQDARSTMVRS
jgi:hypothetical protein